VATLFDFPSDDFGNQFLNEILQSATCSLLRHDIHHSFTDLSNLRGLSIGRLLHLILSTFSECNDKNTQKVSIGGLDIGMGLNKSLPFTYKRLEFIRGEGHSGEIGETVLSLNFVDAEFDFTEGVVFVVL